MPFPMPHLYIAKNVLEKSFFPIHSRSQFYLGSLCPDAVQFSESYDKKKSHICRSGAQWGFVTDNEQWLNDVLDFFCKNVKNSDISFLLGYCIHILADINNNEKLWIPFRLQHENKSFEELVKLSHGEQFAIDQELYQKCSFIEEIFEDLSKSECTDFMDLVSREEMEKIKNNILTIQYANKPQANSKSNKLFLYGQILDFIGDSVEFIIRNMNTVSAGISTNFLQG